MVEVEVGEDEMDLCCCDTGAIIRLFSCTNPSLCKYICAKLSIGAQLAGDSRCMRLASW